MTTTLVEKVGLLPLGYLDLGTQDFPKPCMGAYVGQGRFVTAAHCFAGLQGTSCPANLRIRWITAEQGGFTVGPDATACEKVTKHLGEGSQGDDVAIVTLAALGTWPADSAVLGSSNAILNKDVVMVGPLSGGPSPSIRLRSGKVYETISQTFVHGATPSPGFSGTPVFHANGGDHPSPSTEIAGFYMGTSGSGSRTLMVERVKALLNP